MVAQNYIVCSTVRSGSTLLCKTLGQLHQCGQPEEYFHRHIIKRLKLRQNPEKFLSYCRAIFREGVTHHGIFGIKMHWWQLLDFLTLARQLPQFEDKQDLEILNALFPDLKFIYLWRQNMAEQAVSAAIAAQTGKWEKLDTPKQQSSQHRHKPDEIAASLPKFQPWKIYEWEKNLSDQNQAWQQFLQKNSLSYYETTYEKLTYEFTQEMGRIIEYIGINTDQIPSEIKMPTRRQANQLNQRFMRYYTLIPRPFSGMLYWLYRQLQTVRNGGM